jgi:hypothetical protein
MAGIGATSEEGRPEALLVTDLLRACTRSSLPAWAQRSGVSSVQFAEWLPAGAPPRRGDNKAAFRANWDSDLKQSRMPFLPLMIGQPNELPFQFWQCEHNGRRGGACGCCRTRQRELLVLPSCLDLDVAGMRWPLDLHPRWARWRSGVSIFLESTIHSCGPRRWPSAATSGRQ